MILKIDGVSKIYGNRFSRLRVRALDNISLSVNEGEICCIRGSNGSGKSTLLHLIAGLSHPSSGSIQIVLDRKKINPSPRVGFCPDNPIIYRNVSVSVFLNFILNLLGLKNKKSILVGYLEIFNLMKWIDEPIGTLSKGMLHKVALIASMVDNPQLLVLDEPFSSLDEISTQVLSEKLHQLSSEGSSIIFADPAGERSGKIADKIFNLDKS